MEKKQFDDYIKKIDEAFQKMMKQISIEFEKDLDYEITPHQFFILKLLRENTQVSSGELAEIIGVKPSAITAIVERMEKLNLVKKEKSKKDKRIHVIKLTIKGVEKYEISKKKREVIINKYMSKLENDELKQLLNIYEKLAEIVEKEGDE